MGTESPYGWLADNDECTGTVETDAYLSVAYVNGKICCSYLTSKDVAILQIKEQPFFDKGE